MKTIVLVSRSSGKGLQRTQAILDRYAKRIEANTWSTQITEEGLNTLHSLLIKNSSKKLAISCYHRTHSTLKLLWNIGPSAKLLYDGSIPVHEHKLPPEPLPNYVKVGCLLAEASGYAHDFGKANLDFQNKITPNPNGTEKRPTADPIRHEWISYHLYQEILNLKNLPFNDWSSLLKETLYDLKIKNTVFDSKATISSFEKAIGYLIATHHRFPENSYSLKTFFKNDSLPNKKIELSPTILTDLETPLKHLKNKLNRLEQFTLQNNFLGEELNQTRFWTALSFLVRPALILADHEVSSEIMPSSEKSNNKESMANTMKITDPNGSSKSVVLNQSLKWHLEHVGEKAGKIFYEMQNFKPDGLSSERVENLLAKETSEDFIFHWQDKILKKLDQLPKKPALILNLAGTGAGKTRMNVRALAQICPENREFRFATALNLRSLTLQTITSYKEELDLGEQIAGVIGDQLSQKLYETHKNWKTQQDEIKKTSYLDLDSDEDGNPLQLEFQTNTDKYTKIHAPQWLSHALRNKKMQKMEDVVMAPALACTMDFLVSAGQVVDQAINGVAMMRILTSDLILDEIDSYDPESLVSVLRVVAMSALAGRNIVASSATLSEPCAQALVDAWNFGSALRNSLLLTENSIQEKNTQIIMFDNQIGPTILECSYGEETIIKKDNIETKFGEEYSKHLSNMLNNLSLKKCAKFAEIVSIQFPYPINKENSPINSWLEGIEHSCLEMHERHKQKMEHINKNVSIGLVRVANIKQAILVAKKLSKSLKNEEKAFKICCYHSQLTVIHRDFLERKLDNVLKRKLGNDNIDPMIRNDEIKALAESIDGDELRLIVVATPVEEIGRDHDFDYAIIEPSSTQSIVQTAGRVQRHRNIRPQEANIGILEYPYRYLEALEQAGNKQNVNQSIFTRPGLDVEHNGDNYLKKQREKFKQNTNEASMKQLLDTKKITYLNAGLKFEKINNVEAHPLSTFDNQATTKLLENVGKMFDVNLKETSIWFRKEHYKDYCLRKRKPDGVEVDISIDIDKLANKFSTVKMNYFDSISKSMKNTIKNIHFIEAIENDFFVLKDVKSIKETNEYVQSTFEQLLTCSLTLSQLNNTYDSERLYYHASFGFYKEKKKK